MSVGAIELLFVIICFAISIPVWLMRGPRWIAIIPFFFLVAMLTTPADVVSLLLVGVPNAVVGVALYQTATRSRSSQVS
ncbi:hypothetical protein [Thalassoglobus polymorphus]|uniref:Uncharacterized protein n=1 Tax=Thalassoglobus polymorphus TaxID=2527994 RepID=A0A517QN82_9PLAN|nr:hypothetical protein [Thalassoglobus polymorphus]QDT33027.1 hypothetical protein Mal48_22790 [Thalassoglobus polymorphus]